jgi:DNA-binding XRE family transcriptional regulator
MTQNVSKLRQQLRLQTIEKNILFMTQEEIAKECGVDRRTIERDIEKWRTKGGFKRFLVKEFFELYSKEKLVNPSLALNRIMTLLLKEETKQDETDGKTISIKTSMEQIIKFSREFDADTTTT